MNFLVFGIWNLDHLVHCGRNSVCKYIRNSGKFY
jgi:hypothetical protein